MAFDGCGVTDGFCGTICAKGLRRQCRMVRRQVDSLLAELKNNTAEQSKLRVNAVGLSRGGIACSYLAQEMADIPASSCELSLLLFDPVPGDLLTVAQLDFFRLTNTSASGDMSNCACLSRVLALYPYEPLPAILCHAPILCRYPPHCMVEEEVTLGCHQGALQIHDLRGPVIDLASAMCFLRIRRWLMECGTPLDHNHVDCTVKVKDLEAFCLRKCNAEVKRLSPSSRCSHTALSCWGATIVRHKPDRGVQFLNEQHRLLASAGSDEKWLLEIRTDKAPFPSGLLCLLALVAVLVIWPLLFQS
ncbi:Serine/threonine/tyrosine-interacting protein B [Durusdinium trenchii]